MFYDRLLFRIVLLRHCGKPSACTLAVVLICVLCLVAKYWLPAS